MKPLEFIIVTLLLLCMNLRLSREYVTIELSVVVSLIKKYVSALATIPISEISSMMIVFFILNTIPNL